MAGVELSGRVQSHAGPYRFQVSAQRAAAQAVVGVLEDLGVVVEPPHEQVGVGAKAPDVVPAAGRHAAGPDEICALAQELLAPGLGGGQRAGQAEDGVEGVVVLVVDGLQVDVGGVARVAVGAALLILETVQAAIGRTSAVATGVTAMSAGVAVGVGIHLFSLFFRGCWA